MLGLPDLRQRATASELMDDRSITGHELTEALHQLHRVNQLLGHAQPVVEGVERLWRRAGRPMHLTVIDVGSGLGDMNLRLLRWAERNKVDLWIVLTDVQHATSAEAAAFYCNEPRVHQVTADVFALPFVQADIVTASHLLHHFPDNQISAVLRALLQRARLGVVVNDLHRNIIAWSSIRLLTNLLSQNRMMRNDAALSVARGFRHTDFVALRRVVGFDKLRYHWRWPFRWLVVIPAREGELNA